MKKQKNNKAGRGKPAKQPRPNVRRNNNRDKITNIPVTSAYTIRNSSATKTHVETAHEYIGSMTISSTTPSGKVFVFNMNPLSLSGTRLQRLAGSYAKYRFRALKLTVASNFSTTVSGSLICGYMENPDQQLYSGFEIFNQIFTSSNGVSKSLWSPIELNAKIGDKNKWYNVDDDSDEIMMTTQGKFVIAVQSPVAITNSVSIPILLHYTIEFKEPATQFLATGTLGTPTTFPAATWIQRSSEQEGEYHLNSGGASITSGKLYYINGGVELTLADTSKVIANWMVYLDQSGYSHSFYVAREDAEQHSKRVVVGAEGVTFSTPTLAIQVLN